jgi:hypothetical protein
VTWYAPMICQRPARESLRSQPLRSLKVPAVRLPRGSDRHFSQFIRLIDFSLISAGIATRLRVE